MFSKSFELAVLITLFLAESKKPLLASDLAKKLNISLDFTHQILFKLKKNKIVGTIRGAKGGIYLLRDSEKIRIIEILLAIEPKWFQLKCNTRKIFSNCDDKANCDLKNFFSKVYNTVVKELEIPLASLQLSNICNITKKSLLETN